MNKLIALVLLAALSFSCSSPMVKIGLVPSPTILSEDFTTMDGLGSSGIRDKELECKKELVMKKWYAKVYGTSLDGKIYWGYAYDCETQEGAVNTARTFLKKAGGVSDNWILYFGFEK